MPLVLLTCECGIMVGPEALLMTVSIDEGVMVMVEVAIVLSSYAGSKQIDRSTDR